MELVGRIDGTGALQQLQRGQFGIARGLHHGLVLGAVLVRLEQDAVELLAHRLRAAAGHQLGGPGIDLQLDLALFLDRQQRLLHDFFRRLPEAALGATGATEIMRRVENRQQRGSLLHGGSRVLEIVAGDLAEAEFVFGGEFPQQLHVDIGAQALGLRQQFGWRRLVEREHDVGLLDLDALAGIEFDLGGGFRLGKDASGQILSGLFKHGKHKRAIFPCLPARREFYAG